MRGTIVLTGEHGMLFIMLMIKETESKATAILAHMPQKRTLIE